MTHSAADPSVPVVLVGHRIPLQTSLFKYFPFWDCNIWRRLFRSQRNEVDNTVKSLDVIMNGHLRARTVHLTASETPRQTERERRLQQIQARLQRFENTTVLDFSLNYFLPLHEHWEDTPQLSSSLGLKTKLWATENWSCRSLHEENIERYRQNDLNST